MLRSFKPKDGQDAADGRSSTLKNLASGTKEDKENYDKIKELQGQVSNMDSAVAKQKEDVKAAVEKQKRLAVSEYHGKRVQLFSMTGVAMIVVQPEDGLQFRMAGLVCSPTGARVRVIDPAKDCSDGLFECSLAPAADTSLQRRCLRHWVRRPGPTDMKRAPKTLGRHFPQRRGMRRPCRPGCTQLRTNTAM